MREGWGWQGKAGRQKQELIEGEWDILLHLFLLLFPRDLRHFVLSGAAETDFVLSACCTTALVLHPWEEYLKNKVCFYATGIQFKEPYQEPCLSFLWNKSFHLRVWNDNTARDYPSWMCGRRVSSPRVALLTHLPVGNKRPLLYMCLFTLEW